jgi:hypothetical protein
MCRWLGDAVGWREMISTLNDLLPLGTACGRWLAFVPHPINDFCFFLSPHSFFSLAGK